MQNAKLKLATVDIGREFKLGDKPIFKKCTHYVGDQCVSWQEGVFTDLGSLISTVLPNVYMVASVILFIFLIFGGFTYIVSAGQQKPEGVQQGKNAITAALIGFLLIFASWWLIQIIEVITGIDILQPVFQ